MVKPIIDTGERTCEFCGKVFVRQRYKNGQMPNPTAFRKRRYCSNSCVRRATHERLMSSSLTRQFTETDDGQRWRPIPSTLGYYEASDRGKIRRVKPCMNYPFGYVLNSSPNRDGYPQVSLSIEGRQRTARVHQLVAEAFLGPRPDGYQVNHIDGKRANNSASNLEYVTPSENALHGYRLGRKNGGAKGINHQFAKLDDEKVREIRLLLKSGLSKQKIASRYAVGVATVGDIKLGKTWRHVA